MIFESSLENFEPPRKNESTIGIAARFYKHSKAKNSQELHKFLFGYSTEEIASKYSGGLGVLFDRIENVWREPRDIVYSHTTYPLFRTFMSSIDEANEIEKKLIECKSNQGRSLKTKFMMTAKKTTLDKRLYPKLCVACVNEDVRNGLTPTWYRQHQIPGVDWCLKHQKGLTDYCLNCSKIYFKHKYALPTQKYNCPGDDHKYLGANPKFMDFSKMEEEYSVSNFYKADHWLDYCEFAVAILEANLNPIMPKDWIDAICYGIEENGFDEICQNIKVRTAYDFDCIISKKSQKLKEAHIRSMEPESLIYLALDVFDSPNQFLDILKQIHMNRLYAYSN